MGKLGKSQDLCGFYNIPKWEYWGKSGKIENGKLSESCDFTYHFDCAE